MKRNNITFLSDCLKDMSTITIPHDELWIFFYDCILNIANHGSKDEFSVLSANINLNVKWLGRSISEGSDFKNIYLKVETVSGR